MIDHPVPLGGMCTNQFEPMRELFAAKLKSGQELGASLDLTRLDLNSVAYKTNIGPLETRI